MNDHNPERVPGARPTLLAHRRDVLTRKAPRGENVDRLGLGPVDGGDIAEVRRRRPVVGEHAGDGALSSETQTVSATN